MSHEEQSNKPVIYRYEPLKDFSPTISIESRQGLRIEIGSRLVNQVMHLHYTDARAMIETLCDMYGIVHRDKYIGEK